MADDATRILEEMRARDAAAHREQMLEANAARLRATDKEPFTPAAFEDAMAAYGESSEHRSTLEYEQIEVSYYLRHPDFKTLREMAECVIGIGPLRIDRSTPPPRVESTPAPAPPRVYLAECKLCERDVEATGATRFEHGRLMREFECLCGNRFASWRAEWDG